MSETLGYIESYFENGLSAEERMQFEQRISSDAAFAGEVAFYLQARQALRQELVQQKSNSWQAIPEATNSKTPAPVVPLRKPMLIKRWIGIAAAVIVVLGISLVYLLAGAGGARQIAQDYTDSAFQQLRLNMDASRDNLQQAISYYNSGNLDEAEKMFDNLYETHPEILDALKYSGVVSLKKKNYDKAIQQFQKLSSYDGLFANPGAFYHALTLLLRNKNDDTKQAQALLQQVIDKDLFGKPEAQRILQKIQL